MPELPEVETIKRTLKGKLEGLSFTGVEVFLPKIIKSPVLEVFNSLLPGKKIKKLDRRGKYLIIHLSENFALVVHLRMSGSLIYTEPGTAFAPHTHVVFHLSNGSQLRYTDLRQFGQIYLLEESGLASLAGLNGLGPDPFDPRFTREFFKKGLKQRRSMLKPLLLDQSFVAGIGNIYADEVLFRARIHPRRQSHTLTSREASRLYHVIREVLEEAIENRGTSIRDYVDGEGKEGNYQNMLKVHNREGKACPKCGKTIVRFRLGGRSTYYCPGCQKT
ncbi:MAG: bifunctional DNA-formamidopyrimidine glycosylase/DNA-(apurinic or apyrimidinic site) lyase [Desulfotomaculales bacterium]